MIKEVLWCKRFLTALAPLQKVMETWSLAGVSLLCWQSAAFSLRVNCTLLRITFAMWFFFLQDHRVFFSSRRKQVSFAPWQNLLICCKHAQWLKSKPGVYGNRKICPSTGLKMERSGFYFFFKYPTWPWTSQLQLAFGTSASLAMWLMWGLGGGCAHPWCLHGISPLVSQCCALAAAAAVLVTTPDFVKLNSFQFSGCGTCMGSLGSTFYSSQAVVSVCRLCSEQRR